MPSSKRRRRRPPETNKGLASDRPNLNQTVFSPLAPWSRLPDWWELDAVAVGLPIRGDRTALLSVAARQVLGSRIIYHPPSDFGALADVAAEVLTDVIDHLRVVPDGIEVVDHEFAQALRERVAPLGPSVRVVPLLPAIAAAMDVVQTSRKTRPAQSGAVLWSDWSLPDETVSRVFRAADVVMHNRPWRHVGRGDWFEINLPDGGIACARLVPVPRALCLFEVVSGPLERRTPHWRPQLRQRPRYSLAVIESAMAAQDTVADAREAGWLTEAGACPIVMVDRSPANVLTAKAAHELALIIEGLSEFVTDHVALFDNRASATLPVTASDDVRQLQISLVGPMVDEAGAWTATPLTHGLPLGGAARPEAAWERRVDRAENKAILRVFRHSLHGRMSDNTVVLHMANAHLFFEYLALIRGQPIWSLTESALRNFLYSWLPQYYASITKARAMPRTLGRLFKFLQERYDLVLPWATAVLRERDTFAWRLESARAVADDSVLARWVDMCSADLAARAMLPDDELVADIDNNRLLDAVGPLWQIWRGELIQQGVTDLRTLSAALIARQWAWEQTPHPFLDDKSPLDVVYQSMIHDDGDYVDDDDDDDDYFFDDTDLDYDTHDDVGGGAGE